MNKLTITLAITLIFTIQFATAQADSTLFKKQLPKTSSSTLNMDAIYNRPVFNAGKTPISIGGYVETNYKHLTTDGVSDGHEFEFKRMSIFMSSAISKRVKFLSEIEFENDKDEQLEGKPMEISIEYAAIDVEFNSFLNLRAGIVLNPIGSFNQNHDGPKWDFSNRPIVSTQMLPATFSNAGMGIFGKKYSKNWMLGYELYLTNGLDNSIIDNDKNKTYLPQAKENAAKNSSSNSGSPLFTGKLSIKHNSVGEFGVSYMTGIYNKWQQAGLQIDDKRSCSVFALDYNTTIKKWNTNIVAEFAWVNVQLPTNFNEQFGSKQFGGFIDIVRPIIKKEMLGWEQASLNLGLRVEYVDWNIAKFKNSQTNIADDIWAITPSISFRPNSQTVLRLNYVSQKQRDIIGNPASKTGGIIFGLSTYF